MVDESLGKLKISFNNGTFPSAEHVYSVEDVLKDQMVLIWLTLSHDGDKNRKSWAT